MKKILYLLFSISIASSQVTTEHLLSGSPSLSLAGSDIARPANAWSLFVNPAGLAEKHKKSAVIGTESLYGMPYFTYMLAGIQFDLPRMRNLGLSMENLSTDYEGNSLSREIAVGFSQGLTLQADRNSTLLFGYSIKAYSVGYGQSAGISGDGSDGRSLGNHNTIGLDVGVLATLSERIRFGAKVTNINHPQMGKANTAVYLPRRLQMGLAYSPYDLVWTTAALTHSAGHNTQINAGLTYEILRGVILSSGVQSDPNRFATGFSYTWEFMSFTYGLITHPVLPVSHQVSIEIRRR